MYLSTWIEGMGLAVRSGARDVAVHSVADDSRRVQPGGAFIARAGFPSTTETSTPDNQPVGTAYVREAIERGAVVVVVPPGYALPVPEAVTLVSPRTEGALDQALAGRLTERLLGEPSRQLSLIGITGTNGKTTVGWLSQHLLTHAGVKAGLIGTVCLDTGAGKQPATLTTPGAVQLSYLLHEMVNHGCRAAVMEVSSHALAQRRTDALAFDVGVFTNLTGDHLDYHANMNAYAAAKARLFSLLPDHGWAVLNIDDPHAAQMLPAHRPKIFTAFTSVSPGPEGQRGKGSEGQRGRGAGGRREETPAITQSLNHPITRSPNRQITKSPNINAHAHVQSLSASHSHAVFTGPWGEIDVNLPLAGRYNVANVLQAATAASCVADVRDSLEHSLAHAPSVPGRLQRVHTKTPLQAPDEQIALQADKPSRERGKGAKGQRGRGGMEKRQEQNRPSDEGEPTVLVDYAHTHDALDNVLQALRPLVQGRLIVVVGCGGDREKAKRPKMARIAAHWADLVWITSDNPRTEDPRAIIHDMVQGLDQGEAPIHDSVHIEADRAKAIHAAVLASRSEDTVLIAGKGHEDYQIIGTEKHDFDDRAHAAEALGTWQTRY